MKIERVDAIPVSLPLAKPIRMAGSAVGIAQNVVVRVQTDAGLIGWGECASSPTFSGETQGSIVAAVAGCLAPAIVGEDPMAHARQDAAAIVSVKLLKAGGFTGALRAIHAAEAVHLPLQLTGKVAESSIATAALVHLAVAVRHLQYDLGVTNHYLREDVVVEPIRSVGGHVRPPEGPGLGIEVDEDRLRRLQS